MFREARKEYIRPTTQNTVMMISVSIIFRDLHSRTQFSGYESTPLNSEYFFKPFPRQLR